MFNFHLRLTFNHQEPNDHLNFADRMMVPDSFLQLSLIPWLPSSINLAGMSQSESI